MEFNVMIAALKVIINQTLKITAEDATAPASTVRLKNILELRVCQRFWKVPRPYKIYAKIEGNGSSVS